ncbi:hypothetical protein [Raoultibacter massiliensis]|uniref:Uncharacterized protein n=1 Tax=Raoultibacter massiliensis TaxID=1852371 RepID=A0ABV1J9U7_9ACTN|nr:hypothetical protein [Raoultibacter massiliensis]
MGLKEHVEKSKILSDEELDALKREPVSYENTYNHLKSFIRYRFLIDDDEFWDDRIPKLAEYSIDRLLANIDENDSLGDLSMNCTGSSSAETKYALLLITIRKRLGLTFAPVMAAELDTVPLLAEEVARQLAGIRAAAEPA